MNSREAQAQADHEYAIWMSGGSIDVAPAFGGSNVYPSMRVLDVKAVDESLVFCVTWKNGPEQMKYLFAVDLGSAPSGDMQAASNGIWVQVMRIAEESERFIGEAVPTSRRMAWIVSPYLAQL